MMMMIIIIIAIIVIIHPSFYIELVLLNWHDPKKFIWKTCKWSNVRKWLQHKNMLVARRWKGNFRFFVIALTQSINCAIHTPRKEANSPTVETRDKSYNQTPVSESQQHRAIALATGVPQKAVYNLICTAQWRQYL